MLVARMILRRPSESGRTACRCAAGSICPWSLWITWPSSSLARASAVRSISRMPGKECEDVALLPGQRRADGACNLGLDRLLDASANVAKLQRPTSARAFGKRCIAHQCRKSRAVQRCRHRDQTQIGPKRCLCLKRQRQPEIAVEAAFVHLVEQHCRHTSQFRIGNDAIAENAFGQNQYSRVCRLLAVHARSIANKPTDRLTKQFGDPLCRHPRRKPSGRSNNIWPSHHGSGSMAGATIVVLPAPGGAIRTAFGVSRNPVSKAGKTVSIGNASSAPPPVKDRPIPCRPAKLHPRSCRLRRSMP